MMSDLGKRRVRYVDPEAAMSGKCQTCGTVVECKRRDAIQPRAGRAPDPAIWTDLLSAECPHCSARVFVMEKQDFAGVVKDAK